MRAAGREGTAAHVWVVVALVAAVPLAFDPGGFFLFLPLKSALATGLVASALAVMVLQRRPVPVPAPVVAFGAFVGVLAAAAVAGIGGLSSWIGYPGRYLGVAAWLTFLGAFVLGVSLHGARDRATVTRAVSAVSIAVSAYALLQAVGVDPIEWSEPLDTSRTRSTFGNAAFLAAYLSMIVPLSGRLALDAGEPPRARALHGAAAVAAAVALLTTGTRGAWLGAVAALVAIAALEHRRLRATPRRAVAALAAAAVVVVALATVSPVASRVRSIGDLGEATSRGRLATWERTGELIAERPLLGWGPESYALAFPRVIDAEFERTVGRTVVPDRAHNLFLDVAVWAGVAGVAAYVLLLATVGRAALRQRRDALTVGIAGALVAYLVQLQFSFPVADVDTVFWLLAGLLVAGAPRAVLPSRRWAVVPVAVVLIVAVSGTADVLADRSLRRALTLEASGDLDGAQAAADRTAGLAMGRAQYLEAAARLYQRVGEASRDDTDFDRAMALLDRARRLVPRDPELALARADLLLSWGESTGESARIDDAVAAYRDVLARDRFSSRAHLRLGVALVQLGRDADAEAEWETAASLAPRSPAPLVNLSRLYAQQGRDGEARAAARAALKLDPDDAAAAALVEELSA